MSESARLWARGNDDFTDIKFFDVLRKELRQLVGLFFIGFIVIPARLRVCILRINARNVGGVIEVKTLYVLRFCANE